VDSAAITSVIARCLLDSGFLQQMAEHPDVALEPYDFDSGTRRELLRLDTDRVRKFAGFITKVQHNYLWEWFPYTEVLLRHYQLEIEVFASYCPIHQRIRKIGQASREQKIESFLDFLEATLNEDRSLKYPGLSDVLRHERIQWNLKRDSAGQDGEEGSDGPQAADVSHLRWNELRGLVPRIHGKLWVAEFSYDPLAIIAEIRRGAFDSTALQRNRCSRGYWISTKAEILQIFEFSEAMAVLFQLIDGNSTAEVIVERTLSRLELSGSFNTAQFKPVFEFGGKAGLLSFNAPSATRA
jgi:hypothetical protein